MTIRRSFLTASVLTAAIAGCVDVPTNAIPEPPVQPVKVMGVYEITISEIGAPRMSATVTPSGSGANLDLTPRTSGLTFEVVSTSSFTEGSRAAGGNRYISATYRVRNSTGAPINNLTILPISNAGTLAGTPFSALTLFNGGAASSALASQFAPTGAVTLGGGGGMRATEVDVLQVFEESEVAAISLPAGVTGVFPYGFVVRSATSTTDRTLPVAATANDYAGLVTFAFRYPLTASANTDPFQVSFQVLAVEDSETRMTESIEEGQDTSAVRRIRERAASLGATTVTVLPGSSAAAAAVPDYTGQRQICSVRTAGAAGAATGTITNTAAYTVIGLRHPGESNSACGAYFRSGTATVPAAGAAHTLTLVAMDRYGNVRTDVDSVQVERVSGPSVTLGERVALSGGEAQVQATFAANGTALVRAVGRRVRTEHVFEVGATSVQLNAGDRQSAMAGTAVGVKPSVLVRDGNGNPIAGRSVTFAVASGGGSVTSATVVTNASGIATVGSWTLGATANLNTLTATVAGGAITGNPVTFSAAGCSGGGGGGYALTLCFTTSTTETQRTAFTDAATRWQGLITGDLSNVAIGLDADDCGVSHPSVNLTIDDLVIFAGVETMDGPGAVLGSAGPCLIRNSNSLPVLGIMRFDVADVEALETAGQLGSVILHEMGHVLGIGSLWSTKGLLQSPSSAGSVLDTYFNGANGITGFNNIGGSTYTGGQKVPVENTGGAGTVNAHWRESVLVNELMTGYLNAGANPLSQLTVRSLTDLGYTANAAGADAFFLTLSVRDRGEAPGLLLLNDVWNGPLHRVDAVGRMTRIR